MKKPLLYVSLGILLTAILEFAVRWLKFDDNLILLIIFVVAGIGLLAAGLMMRGK